MANLLYKEHKKGCYVGANTSKGTLDSYCYGYDDRMASYYADLKPNTTYTVQRIDESVRFRVATYTYDAKSLSSTSSVTRSEISQWWWTDSSDPITFTTGDSDIYLVVYYTNESEYTTRVMLNEGGTIQPYEEPTEHLPDVWYETEDGDVTNSSFPKNAPEYAMTKPYPAALWRTTADVENGLPYHLLMPDIVTEKVDIWSLERENVIRVYDMHEPQNGFKHNGLAVLEPTSCISLSELNGRWDVTLTHPMDDYGKWKHLQWQNVLKIGGQLFRIDSQEPVIDERSRTITVHAWHIWYDLADTIIVDSTFAGGTASDFKDFLFDKQENIRDGYDVYKFTGSVNIAGRQGAVEVKNASIAAGLIGLDDCLIGKWGGELYRDNFYFSIQPHMEGAESKSFYLRYTAEMTKISMKIDASELCTYLIARDNYGGEFRTSYVGGLYVLHHHKPKVIYLTYNSQSEAAANLGNDAMRWWGTCSTPKITLEITIANIRNDPRYADFLELQEYSVGDRGIVRCEPLGLDSEQQIIAMEKDELTGDIISVTLGDMKSSLLRPAYMSGTVSDGRSAAEKQIEAMQRELDEINFAVTVPTPIATSEGAYLTASSGKYLIYKED